MVGLIPLIILILDRLKLYKFLRSENWGFFYEILDNRKVHLNKFFCLEVLFLTTSNAWNRNRQRTKNDLNFKNYKKGKWFERKKF